MITPVEIDWETPRRGPSRFAHIVFNGSRKISAIKWIRAHFGYGLKESKDYVEMCIFRGDFWIPVDDIPYEITEVDEDDIFAQVVKKKITSL